MVFMNVINTVLKKDSIIMDQKDKRIGIITYPRIEDGKGRFLQAYALSQALLSMGYDNEIINYLPEEWTIKHSLFAKFKKFLQHPSLSDITTVIKRLFIMPTVKEDESIKKYKTFIEENVPYSLELHPTKEQLCLLDFDAWICGSDQIWNPNFAVGRDDAYYLQFAPKEKRIAYAASMGTLSVTDSQLLKQSQWIKSIPYLSVREVGTQKLLDKYDICAEHVCDPTFLMPPKWWDEFACQRLIEEDYLLLFVFDNNPLPRESADIIAKEKGKKIVCISNYISDQNKYGTVQSLGPKEFVSLFKYADYICTQSFHGVVLSVLFNKSFEAFDRSGSGGLDGQLLRIRDLLDTLDLAKRIGAGDVDCIDLYNQPIDYEKVNVLIEAQRQDGLRYLNRALEDVLSI